MLADKASFAVWAVALADGGVVWALLSAQHQAERPVYSLLIQFALADCSAGIVINFEDDGLVHHLSPVCVCMDLLT